MSRLQSPANQTIEGPIAGMDCADCTQHVRAAIAALPGVQAAEVFLAAEKAMIQRDPAQVDLAAIRQAVGAAGYSVPAPSSAAAPPARLPDGTRPILTLLGVVFGVRHTGLLTGDTAPTAAALATARGTRYQADLLLQDKIAIVRATRLSIGGLQHGG